MEIRKGYAHIESDVFAVNLDQLSNDEYGNEWFNVNLDFTNDEEIPLTFSISKEQLEMMVEELSKFL